MGKRKNLDKLRKQVADVFGFYVQEADLIDTGFKFAVATDCTPVNYETLNRVAEFYGTKDIAFEGGSIETGYCESCAYDQPVLWIMVKNVSQNFEALA